MSLLPRKFISIINTQCFPINIRKCCHVLNIQNIFFFINRYINSMNRKNLSFKLKVNHLADHSPNELRKLRGRRTSVGYNNKKNNGKPFKKTMKVEDIPPEMNWRLRGNTLQNKKVEFKIYYRTTCSDGCS